MGSPHQGESKPTPKEAQKIGRQSQQGQPRSDDHVNSARAGENPNRPDDSSEKVVPQ
jgi:hypothetical protein